MSIIEREREVVSKKKPKHRISVARRNLFGSRMWWATCTCKVFYQGCSLKQEAQRMAAEHLERGA